MRKLALIIAGSLLLLSTHVAKADTWVPYTDGRVGGCWLNNANVLYGCTPQPEKPQTGNSNGSNSSQGYQPQSREDYCWQERQRLKNANENRNRTITSIRAAEDRFARSGCQ